MAVSRKVGGVYMFVEQYLTGVTQCIQGNLLCRGKKDYSFARLNYGIVYY